jgi:hypothetical protein
MRIWPAGSILVLETFSGKTALLENAKPTAIDCIRKFKPDLASFPVSTLFAGEWSYQSFSVEGKVLPAPEGASACHQCHSTAFSVTGDLVFTLFSQNEAIEKDQK